MKKTLLAAAMLVATVAAGLTTYDAMAAGNDTPGTQPAQGPFPSQVVGP